jgi:hypothetical protein
MAYYSQSFNDKFNPRICTDQELMEKLEDDARRRADYERELEDLRDLHKLKRQQAEKDFLSGRFDRLNLSGPETMQAEKMHHNGAAAYHHGRQPSRTRRPRQPSYSSRDEHPPASRHCPIRRDSNTGRHDGYVDDDEESCVINSPLANKSVSPGDSISCVGRSYRPPTRRPTGEGTLGFEPVDERPDVAGGAAAPPRERLPTRRHSRERLSYELWRERQCEYKPRPGYDIHYCYVQPPCPPFPSHLPLQKERRSSRQSPAGYESPPRVPMAPPAAGLGYNNLYHDQIARCPPY